jgi:hypothetical protein
MIFYDASLFFLRICGGLIFEIFGRKERHMLSWRRLKSTIFLSLALGNILTEKYHATKTSHYVAKPWACHSSGY